MSHSIEEENARTLAPLTESRSFSRYMICTSLALSATKSSPEPVHCIMSTPSPVIACLNILLRPPEPLFSKRTSPW
jgi:hypothetical protein